MKNTGFSLLELLVASALSTLVIAGLIPIYIGIKTNSQYQHALMDLQDSQRFAQILLSQRIRAAGFVGCADASNPVEQSQAIVGYDNNTLPAALQNQVVSGTDAVSIRSCLSQSQISQNAQLANMAYYVGDTYRTNQQGQPVLALFQKPLDSGDRVELVAGVEQMQIRYGIAGNSAASPLTYYTAAQITDWRAVRSLQIELLTNSIDPFLKKPQTYYFNGESITPNDLLLHKPWSVYVSLRERGVKYAG